MSDPREVRYTIHTFAAARELLGPTLHIALPPSACTRDLRNKLLETYPDLKTLKDFAIARNEAYALPEEVLEKGDEIVIIPPVSGG